jgi:hypothetical protein
MGTIISAEDLDKLEDVEPVVESLGAKKTEEPKPMDVPEQDPASAVQPSEITKPEPMQVATEEQAANIQAPEPQQKAPTGPVISAEALDSMDGETVDFEQFDENNVINKSPLGFFERSAVSYATEKRKKSYLQERFGKNNVKETKDDNKYFIRNRDGKWYREDPTIGASFRFSADAMKELAADALADFQPELIRLAGQGAGAAAGAGMGVPLALPTIGQSVTTGALAGSAVGRGAGQGIVELAGKLNGMRPETTLQDAFVEMGRQGAYGATSEVLGPYMAKGLQKAVSLPGKALSAGMNAAGAKLQSAVNKNAAFADFLDSFWGGVAGIPKDAAKRMRELGKSVINNPKYRDVANTVEPLLINGTKALENYEQEASKQYAQTVKIAAKAKVWVMDVYDAMRGALQGKINPLTGTRTSSVASPAEGADLDKLANYFSGMLKIKGLRFNPTAAGKASVIRKGEMTLGQLKSMITDIDDRIAQWSSEGASYMARMGRQVRYALTQVLHKNPEYLAADKEFEAVQFFLKSLNVIDKNMSGIDKFLKSYSSLPEWLKARLWKLEKSLPKDKQFLEEGLTMAAANVWNELGKLNFASLAQLGLGRYFGGNLGLGLAFLVRNPKLLQKFVFGSFEQAPNFIKAAATGAGNIAGKAGRTAAFLGTEKIGRTLEEAVTKPMGVAEAAEPTQKKSPDSGSNAEIWEEVPPENGEKLAEATSKAVEINGLEADVLDGALEELGKNFEPIGKALKGLGDIFSTPLNVVRGMVEGKPSESTPPKSESLLSYAASAGRRGILESKSLKLVVDLIQDKFPDINPVAAGLIASVADAYLLGVRGGLSAVGKIFSKEVFSQAAENMAKLPTWNPMVRKLAARVGQDFKSAEVMAKKIVMNAMEKADKGLLRALEININEALGAVPGNQRGFANIGGNPKPGSAPKKIIPTELHALQKSKMSEPEIGKFVTVHGKRLREAIEGGATGEKLDRVVKALREGKPILSGGNAAVKSALKPKYIPEGTKLDVGDPTQSREANGGYIGKFTIMPNNDIYIAEPGMHHDSAFDIKLYSKTGPTKIDGHHYDHMIRAIQSPDGEIVYLRASTDKALDVMHEKAKRTNNPLDWERFWNRQVAFQKEKAHKIFKNRPGLKVIVAS